MRKYDKYTVRRGDTFYYVRNIPKDMEKYDGRYPRTTISLKTGNRAEARKLRTQHQRADDQYWESLRAGMKPADAYEAHKAALDLVYNFNFEPLDASNLSFHNQEDAREIGTRILAVAKRMSDKPIWELNSDEIDSLVYSDGFGVATNALTGRVPVPANNITTAFGDYVDNIAEPDRANMTEKGAINWIKQRQIAVDVLLNVVGEKPMTDLNREDGRRVHAFLKARIAKKELAPATAKKRMTDLKVFYDRYFEATGEDVVRNPFEALRFTRRGEPVASKPHPSFSPEQIQQMLTTDILAGLKSELRHPFVLTILLGLRPQEALTLAPSQIHLDTNQPFIEIAPLFDGPYMHPVKNKNAKRELPLDGLALEIMRENPSGFEHYWSKVDGWGQLVSKYLKKVGLKTTRGEVPRSARASFEERAANAGVPEDMRRDLFGHAPLGNRPVYGDGFYLEKKAEALALINPPLEYHPCLV